MITKSPKVGKGYALCRNAKDVARRGVEYWDGQEWLATAVSVRYRNYKFMPYRYPLSGQSRLELEEKQTSVTKRKTQ
jgi:hypothetical protein